MAPTRHHISPNTTELRRPERRPGRHSSVNVRMRTRAPRTRITFAESPELYLREEMC